MQAMTRESNFLNLRYVQRLALPLLSNPMFARVRAGIGCRVTRGQPPRQGLSRRYLEYPPASEMTVLEERRRVQPSREGPKANDARACLLPDMACCRELGFTPGSLIENRVALMVGKPIPLPGLLEGAQAAKAETRSAFKTTNVNAWRFDHGAYATARVTSIVT
jgi:hypothetical protein